MRRSSVVFLVSLVVIASVGSSLAYGMVSAEEDYLRSQLISQATLAAHGVNLTALMSLSGSEDDLSKPEYQGIKELLTCYREDIPGVRFVYIIGLLGNGTPFFYVDSEPAGSPDYSPPGQLYIDDPLAFNPAFAGEEWVTEPETDSWGEWVTAMVPITDPSNDEVVAVLCLDMDAAIWQAKVLAGGIPYAMATVFVGALVISFYVIERRQEEKGREMAKAAMELKQVNDKLGILSSITRHDIKNQVTVLNGYLALVASKIEDPAAKAYLGKMERAISNIHDHIEFTKDYQEIGVKAPQWANVRNHFRISFSMLNPPNVRLEDNTEGLEILADPLVGKVYYNLIDNSVQHGEKVSVIRLWAVEEGEVLKLTYEDDGVGLTESARASLFKDKDTALGGLGLLLIRDILAITGISIEEKGGEGKGARFVMTVPPDAWRRDGIGT
ncbi:MAG: ATP-binding protein [Methanomassiliicoccales archaeon]